MRGAAVGWVNRVESAADQPGVDGALRDLVARIPACLVRHRGDVEAIARVAATIAQHAVELAETIRMHERPVVVEPFNGIKQSAIGEGRRVGNQRAAIAVLPDPERGNALRKGIGVFEMHRTGRREIALARKVRPLAIFKTAGQLGNDEIHIRPALTVPMRSLVHQHAVHRRTQVGAVIEIEATQVELVGLALAAVLADDQARHRFQQLAGPIDRARFKLLLRDGAHACSISHTDAGHIAGNDNLLKCLLAASKNFRRESDADDEKCGSM